MAFVVIAEQGGFVKCLSHKTANWPPTLRIFDPQTGGHIQVVHDNKLIKDL